MSNEYDFREKGKKKYESNKIHNHIDSGCAWRRSAPRSRRAGGSGAACRGESLRGHERTAASGSERDYRSPEQDLRRETGTDRKQHEERQSEGRMERLRLVRDSCRSSVFGHFTPYPCSAKQDREAHPEGPDQGPDRDPERPSETFLPQSRLHVRRSAEIQGRRQQERRPEAALPVRSQHPQTDHIA